MSKRTLPLHEYTIEICLVGGIDILPVVKMFFRLYTQSPSRFVFAQDSYSLRPISKS